MTDLWAFLMQTLTVSLVAALLLVLKAAFRDKLSPRWQYGVWAILALRVVLPAGMGGQMLFSFFRWVETARLTVESHLSSAFSDVWSTTQAAFPIPWLTVAPQSITDWLFCLYAVGVPVTLAWFLFGYLRLRRSLRPAPQRQEQAARVARRYGLPLPRTAEGNVPSAFVCGPLRPTLVLPRGQEVDDKVILHELLHLKYGDLWLNLLCCLLRCLHWCNPFLWWVFDRVGNDAEALCDQRVLERLEGEERRDYGRILLSMADDRYARLPGTTSMANGGRNIKARIQSIARFKRYPQGMALVSLCIVLILAPVCLTGAAGAAVLPVPSDHDARAELTPDELRAVLLRDFALARSNRPATAAGALDCYAKAVINNNAYYLAAVSDVEIQQALYQTLLERNDDTWEWGNYYLDMGVFLGDVPGRPFEDRRYSASGLPPYLTVNLTETPEGYDAAVLFFYAYADAESHPHTSYIAHQVKLTLEEGGWLVEQVKTNGPVELSDMDATDFAWGYPYFPGLDLAELTFPEQNGFQSSLHIQKLSFAGEETLTGQPYDHMICGFGNHILSVPDLDSQFAETALYGRLEIRYPDASPGADLCGSYELDVYSGDRQLNSIGTSVFLPLAVDPGGGVPSLQIAVGALETDDGDLVDRIQFSFALARETEGGGQSPVAYLSPHTEHFDLTEVIP